MTKPAAPIPGAAYSGLSNQIIKFEKDIGQLKAIARTRGAAYDEERDDDIQQRRTAQHHLLAQIVGKNDLEDLAAGVDAKGEVGPDGRILALVRAAAMKVGSMAQTPTLSEGEKKRVLNDLVAKLGGSTGSNG